MIETIVGGIFTLFFAGAAICGLAMLLMMTAWMYRDLRDRWGKEE